MRIFSILALAMIGSACGRVASEASHPTHVSFGSELTLVESASNPSLSVCVMHSAERRGAPLDEEAQALLDAHLETIKSSIGIWVDALRPIAAVSLANEVEIKRTQDGCRAAEPSLGDSGGLNAGLADATVIFDPATLTSFASLRAPPAHPVVVIGRQRLASRAPFVILHEFGHAFGLGDAYRYVPQGGTRPQYGQPLSVMSTSSYTTLQADDVAGVQHQFCARRPALAKADKCAAVPPPGLVAHAEAKFHFTGVTFRDAETAWGPGVVVETLSDVAPLRTAGLRRQDVLRQLGDFPISRWSDVEAALLYAHIDLVDVVVRRYDDPSRTRYHDERLFLQLTPR